MSPRKRAAFTDLRARANLQCATSERPRKKWRTGRDSNPRYPFGVYSLSRGALSTTQPPVQFLREGEEITLALPRQSSLVILSEVLDLGR